MENVMKEITATMISHIEFDQFIVDLGVKYYRSVLDNNWHNDSLYLFDNVSVDDLDDSDRADLEKEIRLGGANWEPNEFGYGTEYYNAREWLALLIERGKLAPGTYLINVCW